jgi:lipopolysaccharide export system permease protein
MHVILVFVYLLREVVPQFITSLCILSAVLVVSQLVRISEVLIAFGFSLENVLLPFLFIVLPFLSFTIPMAMLFAVLLAFSRMSSDGEYTALLAAGFSLSKAARPVMMMAGLLFVIGAFFAANLEPWGRRELVSFYHRKTQGELDNLIKYKLQPGVFMDNFLGFVLYAETISPDRTHFENVMLAPGLGTSKQNFSLLAPSGSITGSVEDGDLRMSFDYGVVYTANPESDDISITKFKRTELDVVRIFQDQIFGSGPDLNDYRALPPFKLWQYIDEIRKKSAKTPEQEARNRDLYLKSRFLFHQRLSLPFATITFALFAMVLGIHDQRQGRNYAYLGAILTIITAYIFTMGFKWLAEQGYLPAPLAAWAPNIILLGIGVFVVNQRNRLPPSESVIDPRNIPGLQRIWRQRFRSL